MVDQPKKPGDHKAADEKSAPSSTGKAHGRFAAYVLPLVAASSAIVIVTAGAVWYFNHESRPEPPQLMARALKILDEPESREALTEARRIASELDGLHYRDPEFAGAVQYILGMADFLKIRAERDRERQEPYRSVIRHLEQAFITGIDAGHRQKAEFAIGMSRYTIGDVAGASHPLKEAISGWLGDKVPEPPAEFFEAAAALQEVDLNRRGPNDLKEAIALNDEVLKKTNVDPAERNQTLLRRAEIFVALHEGENARQALSELSKGMSAKREATLIRAQIEIAEGQADKEHFVKAHQLLEPIANAGGLENFYSRQALYLLGVCYEAETDYENALRRYSDVVRRFPDSPEGLASNVRRADLLRKGQRWEEALEAYVRALDLIPPTGLNNRWLRVEDFRASAIAAWNDLKATRAYEFAVELSRHMRPLFPPKEAFEALERVATANKLWATQIEADIADRPWKVREERGPELLERWRTSGRAHAELAEALVDSPKYADILWISAEHYRKGHDFANALVQMTRFINSQPRQRLPLAYVRRGEILMDLGRYDEALDHFERVLAQFPTDIAAFPAMYLIGVCEVERNNPERAVDAWQRVLREGDLDPSANEWQMSLFALGRLQFEIALTMKPEPNAASPEAPAETSGEGRARPLAAFDRLNDAIRRFQEFVARYPKRPEAPEARFLLAKALRDRAKLPRQKLRQAETDNARKELQKEIQRLLAEAEGQIDTLIETLQIKENAGLLDPLGQRMLRDGYFERAHNLFALEKFDRAIEAYTNAANRYPEDPNVLLAYLQIANCYDRLGKPIDARGVALQVMLIQKNMPDSAFTPDKSLLNRDDWKTWLEWESAQRQAHGRDERKTPVPSTTSSSEYPQFDFNPFSQTAKSS